MIETLEDRRRRGAVWHLPNALDHDIELENDIHVVVGVLLFEPWEGHLKMETPLEIQLTTRRTSTTL